MAVTTGCGRIAFQPEGQDASSDTSTRSYRETVLDDQPTAYFRVEETSGTIATSEVGTATGSFQSSTTATLVQSQPGAVDQDMAGSNLALTVRGEGNAGDGSAAGVLLNPSLIDWSGDFTIELWVKPNEPNPPGWSGHAFVCEEYLVNGIRLGWTEDMLVRVWTDEGGATTRQQTSSQLVVGQWTYVVAARSGSDITVYVDGAPVLTGPLDLVLPSPAAECGFGALHGMFTAATFDEVALYEYALPAANVAAHFAAR